MSFAEDPSNAIRNEVRDFANANGLTFFNPRALGFIENLDVAYRFDWAKSLIQFLKTIKPIES
jgi:hypothetical protein